MNWEEITKNISKAMDTAQQIGKMAAEHQQTVTKGISAIKSVSEIVNSKDSIITKGQKLFELSGTVLSESECEKETGDVQQQKSISDENTVSEQLIEPTDEVDEIEDEEVEEVEEVDSTAKPESEIPTSIISACDAVSAISMMGTEIAKAVQVCQIEETKRTEIKARMEVEVTRINAISNLLSEYLNKTFDERADLFNNYFSVLDKAIESGDTALMSATLSSINSLAAQSPFKNLADITAVQRQLEQADTEWDI